MHMDREKWSSANARGRLYQKPTLLKPYLGLLTAKTVRKNKFV